MSEFSVFSKEPLEKLAVAKLEEKDPLELAKEKNVGREEALERVRELAIVASKKRIREAVKRDMLVIQAVSALDELNETTNLLSNRLREWYGLHAPEITRETSSMDKYISIVNSNKDESPMGLDLEKDDYEIIKSHAKTITELFAHKRAIEEYLEKLMGDIAPNLTSLAGAGLAARLIAKGGSLEKIARTSASTLQVYGAERALFKHLLKGTPCPKHGLIFQHPAILGAKRTQRGKIARALAGKLAIAARIDFYSTKLNKQISRDFEKRLAAIRSEKEWTNRKTSA